MVAWFLASPFGRWLAFIGGAALTVMGALLLGRRQGRQEERTRNEIEWRREQAELREAAHEAGRDVDLGGDDDSKRERLRRDGWGSP